jgi:hypothetical protein
MDAFLDRHADKIQGSLSCFDRVLFRGYLPLFSGREMTPFLKRQGVRPDGLKDFLLGQAERLKQHARQLARRDGRPFLYFAERVRKDEKAREIAARKGITDGLVCVLSTLEPCWTFALRWEGASYVRPARRKCLFLYFYFMDRELGLIHVKLQTWFPMQLQVYVNGHEWLARKLTHSGVPYLKHDNVFLHVDDLRRAQRFADRFAGLDWVRRLDRYAHAVNPLLAERLAPLRYYWVTAQAEYATDILFTSRRQLQELMPRLLEHSTLHLSARDVMGFLGRKLTGHFLGEVVTDHKELPLHGRLPGCRVKHRMKGNWIKMYDKDGLVLRVETVINDPGEFRVRRRVRRGGRRVTAWVPLRKSVAYLFRYREISLQSNARYLNPLAQVEDPTRGVRALDAITARKKTHGSRTVKPFHPLSPLDTQLFATLMRGEHALHGFTNRDLRAKLDPSAFHLRADPRRCSAQVTRLLHRLHVYRLIAKIPRSRRWRVTDFGWRVMSAALDLRSRAFPEAFAAAA